MFQSDKWPFTPTDLPPRELCDAMFAELAAFQAGAKQFDDMAILITQIK